MDYHDHDDNLVYPNLVTADIRATKPNAPTASQPPPAASLLRRLTPACQAPSLPRYDFEVERAVLARAEKQLREESSPAVRPSPAPAHATGAKVSYRRGDEPAVGATVLAVHTDDSAGVYYTIKCEDGREIQTDDAHLTATRGGFSFAKAFVAAM